MEAVSWSRQASAVRSGLMCSHPAVLRAWHRTGLLRKRLSSRNQEGRHCVRPACPRPLCHTGVSAS